MEIFNFLSRVFMSGDVGAWVRVLLELFDFMVKASAAYRMTPEGRKEWADFADRYEAAVNNSANDGNVSYSVESASETTPQAKQGKRRFAVEE